MLKASQSHNHRQNYVLSKTSSGAEALNPRCVLHELLCPNEVVSSPPAVDVEVAAEDGGLVWVHQVTWRVTMVNMMMTA